jgi:hypothetical protein
MTETFISDSKIKQYPIHPRWLLLGKSGKEIKRDEERCGYKLTTPQGK